MLYDNDGLRALSAVHQFGNGFIQIGETIFWMGLSYTARNPGEALAITFMLSNPTFRGILAKMLRHQLGQMAVDLRFYGRLVATDLLGPIFATARTYARIALRSPITYGAAGVLAGASITAANQQMINNNAIALNPALDREDGADSSALMWSPFGGMQLGIAIS